MKGAKLTATVLLQTCVALLIALVILLVKVLQPGAPSLLHDLGGYYSGIAVLSGILMGLAIAAMSVGMAIGPAGQCSAGSLERGAWI
jgi:hypothetical protein